MSEKSKIALDLALNGRVPVSVYSANKVFKGFEDGNSNIAILNIPGLTRIIGEAEYDSDESDELLAGKVAAMVVPLSSGW